MGYHSIFPSTWEMPASNAGTPPATTAQGRMEPDGEDRFRTVSGDERGELLRALRGEDGEVEKLYWATYPFTRTPQTFGAGSNTSDSN